MIDVPPHRCRQVPVGVGMLAGDFPDGVVELLSDFVVAMIDVAGEDVVESMAAEQGFGEAQDAELGVAHLRHQLFFGEADALDLVAMALALRESPPGGMGKDIDDHDGFAVGGEQEVRGRECGIVGMGGEDDGIDEFFGAARGEGRTPEDKLALVVQFHQFCGRIEFGKRVRAVAPL